MASLRGGGAHQNFTNDSLQKYSNFKKTKAFLGPPKTLDLGVQFPGPFLVGNCAENPMLSVPI